MELFQLQQFRAIVESETMVDAARKLYLTQPTLSRNIAKFESELDCKLFSRKHNKMTLTPCGEVVYESAQNIENEFQKMLDGIKAIKKSEAEQLRIGVFSGPVAACHLFTVAAYNPSVFFEFTNAPEEILWSGLRDGAFDMIIHTSRPSFPGVTTEYLEQEQMLVFFPLESEFGKQESLSDDDIRNLPFLMIPQGLPGQTDWYERFVRDIGMSPDRVLREDVDKLLGLRSKPIHPSLGTNTLNNDSAENELTQRIVPLDSDRARRDIFISYVGKLSEQNARILKDIHSVEAKDMGALLSYFIIHSEQSNVVWRFSTDE